MKITIECDTEGETAKTQVYKKVFEFALAGNHMKEGMYPSSFSSVCTQRDGNDKPVRPYDLEGYVYTVLMRLRDVGTS